jgi:predicted lipoprotein with Yx(FWY)xxD motif
MAVLSSGMQMTQGGTHPVGRDRPGQEMVNMGKSFLARVPVPVKLGVPVAAGLLAAACGSAAGPATGSAASGGTSGAPAAGTVIESHAGSGGTFLTDGSGRAVYLFSADGMNKATCSGACTSLWPPVTAKGQLTGSGGAKAADLSTISRPGGGKQVTYHGHALYYFSGDSGPGQTSGQGLDDFGAKWWLVAPTGAQITAADSATGSSSSTAPASGGGASSGSSGGGWG